MCVHKCGSFHGRQASSTGTFENIEVEIGDCAFKIVLNPFDIRKYRSAVEEDEKKIWGSSPFFGVFLAAENKGSIKTGDSIFISQDI